MFIRSRKSGFTLLELLVVVIVVGILAAVALPKFSGMFAKARSAEGLNTVGAIMTAEYVHFQEFNNFTTDGTELLVDIPADGDTLFNYTFASADSTASVSITASGIDQADSVTILGTIYEGGTREITTSID